MKKSINRTTVLIVLAVFLSISVGYALFSDTITIEGTATAQGNFDITMSAQFGYPESFKSVVEDSFENGAMGEKGYKDGDLIINDDKLTYSISFDYPDSQRFVTVKLTNTGSINAKVDMNNMVLSNWETCYDGYVESVYDEKILNGTIEENECYDSTGKFQVINDYPLPVAFESPENEILFTNSNSPELSNYLINQTTAVLEPNESVYLVIQNWFGGDIIDPGINSFNLRETGTFQFLFEQENS